MIYYYIRAHTSTVDAQAACAESVRTRHRHQHQPAEVRPLLDRTRTSSSPAGQERKATAGWRKATVAGAGRIDGSTKSDRVRRTVTISCTAPARAARPVFLLSASGGTGTAARALPCLSARVAATAPAPARPTYPMRVHVRFNTRPATNVSCPSLLRYVTAYTLSQYIYAAGRRQR